MDRLERLVNLVIALRETRVPLLAADIRSRVAGYGQPDAEAFRRMFERDKADLRALGVPIETEPIDRLGDDRLGYRIDPAAYDLPALDFTPSELTALALAVDATGLADRAAAGLRKLEVDVGVPGLTRRSDGTGLAVDLRAPQLDALAEAQLTRTTVTFTYRTASGASGSRVVDPHALVHRTGRWYLVGHDHDRGATRAFRLDRIIDGVRPRGGPGAFPARTDPVDVAAVVPGIPDGAPTTAIVRASPELAWQVARTARGGGAALPDGWTRFTVPVGDPDTFVGWALGHAGDLVVQEPEELRARVIAALQTAARPGGEPGEVAS
jgi:predicted DNA-binding transcriptional regulator YafY